MQIGETLSLKCSTARPDRQKQKISANWTEFVHPEIWDFVKLILTRISSHWLWLESRLLILWKTWLESCWVTLFLNVTRVESELPKSWLESSHWLESRFHWFFVRYCKCSKIKHNIQFQRLWETPLKQTYKIITVIYSSETELTVPSKFQTRWSSSIRLGRIYQIQIHVYLWFVPEVYGIWNIWLRLRSSFGWIYSDSAPNSKTFLSFALQLLLKLEI